MPDDNNRFHWNHFCISIDVDDDADDDDNAENENDGDDKVDNSHIGKTSITHTSTQSVHRKLMQSKLVR